MLVVESMLMELLGLGIRWACSMDRRDSALRIWAKQKGLGRQKAFGGYTEPLCTASLDEAVAG